MTPDNLIASARELLGFPFRHQGRSPSGKVDCAGVICHTAERNGIPYADQRDYPRQPGGSRLESALDTQPSLVRVPKSQVLAGDVLLMRFDGEPQHLALYTGENIIHAYETMGKVVEHALTDIWNRRIVAVYRFAGVEHE